MQYNLDELNDLLCLNFDSSDNPSESELLLNGYTNSLIEEMLEDEDGFNPDELIQLVESNGIDPDQYVASVIEAVEYAELGSGLIIPCWHT